MTKDATKVKTLFFPNLYAYIYVNVLLILAKIRRLYDIANVLSSIGLIEKCCQQTSVNKPAYRYIGPRVEIIREAECKLIYIFQFFFFIPNHLP